MNTGKQTLLYAQYRPRLLARLRAFLLMEESLLRRYGRVMELIRRDILEEDTPSLEEHNRIEQSLIRELSELRRSIAPLRRQAEEQESGGLPELAPLESASASLVRQALEQNRKNRELLEERLPLLRQRQQESRSRRIPGFSGSAPADSRYLNLSV